MKSCIAPALLASSLAIFSAPASADAITDWNQKTGQFIGEARIGTPPAVRVVAIVQTAALDALGTAPRQLAGAEAAIAAAHRATLVALLPAAQHPAIEQAYQAALAPLAEGPQKAAGIAAGERAAAAVLAARADDALTAPDGYRPHAAAGQYVPTAAPAATPWPRRKPWLLDSPAQFRPGPPPALNSEAWARDFNEVKTLGGRSGSARNAEQTEIARFWDYSLPAIYHGVVRSVALAPGRDLERNARLFATVAQAMDDALISVFDAKYSYNFWRPITAIRNGDADNNDATTRDASWTPMIDTPMHPEYPSAHSVLAASVGAVLKAELAGNAMPVLATSSPTANNATRRWTSIDAFVAEVGNARVWEGVHYRFSAETGAAMGKQIGELAAARKLAPPF